MSVFTDSSIYKHFFFPVFLFCFGNLNKEDIDSESYVTWFCWKNLIYPYFTKRFAKLWNARMQIRLVSRPQLFLIKKLILCNISSWERYVLEERWKKGSKVPPISRNLDKSSAMNFFWLWNLSFFFYSTQTSSALFFQYNTQLGPPYHVIVDTNFINFSIQNKLDIFQSMVDCLYAKCKFILKKFTENTFTINVCRM